jgi:hypothetical protein
VFCEDALGHYIALYHERPMASPVSPDYPGWSLGDRIWRDKIWGFDVTSFARGRDGKTLHVAPSMIHGDGGVFHVDLQTRNAKRIFPRGQFETGFAYVTEILDLDPKGTALNCLATKYLNNGGDSTVESHQIHIKR